MPYPNPPPPGPLRTVGSIIPRVRFGPRHQLYIGDQLYVQRENNRYYCRILTLHLEPIKGQSAYHKWMRSNHYTYYVADCLILNAPQ